MLPSVKHETNPKTSSQKPVFQSSFESFLTAKEINLSETLSLAKPLPISNTNHVYNDDTSETPIKKRRGRKPATVFTEPENIDDLQNGKHAIETGPNKWSQTCENCPSLVHLIYNHLMEISDGRHHPIQYGTPANEIIEHLSEALGYNERQIQRMITMGEKPYRCRHCIEAYATKVELQTHISEQHADVKRIPCLECEKMFHSKDNLRAHMQTAHKPKQHKEFPCSVEGCDKEYVNFKMLERHLDKVHADIAMEAKARYGYEQQQEVSLPIHDFGQQIFDEQAEYGQALAVVSRRGRGRGRGRGGAGTSRGRGGKRGRMTKKKMMDSDMSSDEAQLEGDDEFLVNTESDISSEDDEIDYVEDRF